MLGFPKVRRQHGYGGSSPPARAGIQQKPCDEPRLLYRRDPLTCGVPRTSA